MNITNILVAFCSLFFFMVGADKFFNFLEPPCSMMEYIPQSVWYGLGVLQLAAGILLWMPKYRKHIAGFFAVFMMVFTVIHIFKHTPDYGGSAFMGVLLVLLIKSDMFGGKKEVKA